MLWVSRTAGELFEEGGEANGDAGDGVAHEDAHHGDEVLGLPPGASADDQQQHVEQE